MRLHTLIPSVVAGAVATYASLDSAWAQHGDVWLHADVPNSKLAVGVVDEVGTTFTPGVRVLEAILLPDTLPFTTLEYLAADPGFRSAAGDLPPAQAISITIESLQAWNGAGLSPAPGVAFSFHQGGGLASEADGSLHAHPLFGLTDLTLDPLPLPDGAYVGSFRASTAGFAPSDPYYFVMLKDELIGDENDAAELEELLEAYANGGPAPIFGGKDFSFFEDAVEFVHAAVPEPNGAVLATLAATSLAIARRRRMQDPVPCMQRRFAADESYSLSGTLR